MVLLILACSRRCRRLPGRRAARKGGCLLVDLHQPPGSAVFLKQIRKKPDELPDLPHSLLANPRKECRLHCLVGRVMGRGEEEKQRATLMDMGNSGKGH